MLLIHRMMPSDIASCCPGKTFPLPSLILLLSACRRERKERTLDVISNNAAEFELWFWGTQVRHV